MKCKKRHLLAFCVVMAASCRTIPNEKSVLGLYNEANFARDHSDIESATQRYKTMVRNHSSSVYFQPALLAWTDVLIEQGKWTDAEALLLQYKPVLDEGTLVDATLSRKIAIAAGRGDTSALLEASEELITEYPKSPFATGILWPMPQSNRCTGATDQTPE